MNYLKKYLTKQKIKEFILINIGIFLVAFSFTFFLDKNDLIFGGVGGIGTIINFYIPVLPLSLVVLVINVILLILGLILVDKEFCLKTLYGSIAYPFFSFIFELIQNAVGKEIFIEIFNQNIFQGIISYSH